MNMQSIIIEDEPLAREGLQLYSGQVEFLDIKAACEDALQANRYLAGNPVDLMFLDVQMPGITGIDFLKTLKTPPMVILTTAFPNFALQGYELDVVDYLVKPYPFDRFLKAVNKAYDLFKLKNGKEGEVKEGDDYFFVKCDARFEKIHFADILYVNGMENYVVIHTTGRQYITLLRMKSVEDSLPERDFMRIHKSYIASIKAISAIDGNEIIIGSKRLPLSREKKTEILKRLLKA